MARYEHLPIYKKALETAVYLQGVIRGFSRYDKYSVGADLKDLSRQILRLIVRANSAVDKQQSLRELVEYCEMLKITLVFAKEVKAFNNFKSFQQASGLAVQLCRQSEGWLKSSRSGRNQQPPSAGR